MGDVVQFPSRGHPPEVLPCRTYRPRLPRGELMKHEDVERGGKTSTWIVDWWAGSEDTICMMGRFNTEAEADRFIASWNRDHPEPPSGAA